MGVLRGVRFPPILLNLFYHTKHKAMKKYNYWNVIQQNYGQGWEDVSFYEAYSNGSYKDYKLLFHDVKEYRLTGYATRVIFRKEKIKLETNVFA